MQLTRLTTHGLRRLSHVELVPSDGLNLITGENGAGKTSLLEALHLMAYGRSFRGRVRDGLIQPGAEAVEVFVEWREGPERRLRRAGLCHTGQSWTGRLDGQDVAQLGELCAALAVVSFEPGSHALVTGGGEPRKKSGGSELPHAGRAAATSMAGRSAEAVSRGQGIQRRPATPWKPSH